MHALLQDVRYGLRMLAKNPSFTAVAVLTLALGIGANTAIFSVLNGVLLRPLPYPSPKQIVQFNLEWKDGTLNDTLTAPEFEFYRDHSSAFAALAAFRGNEELSIKRGNSTEWIRSLRVSDGFFPALGVHPALGRGILKDETRPGSAQVAILSESLWRSAFGADPAVIGRQVELDDIAYTVVGVMPTGFSFVEQPVDIFIPLQLGRSIEDTGMNTRVIARLGPGTSLTQAQANMDVVFEQFRRQGSAQSGQRGIQLESYQRWLAGDLRVSLLMLFGAVGFLLLIACANVASLVMARTSSRQREISIRMALGARRANVLRMVVAEGVALVTVGIVIGLAGALALSRFLSSLLSGVRATNLSTYAAVSGVLLAVGLLASYIPARRATKVDPLVALRYE